MSDTWAKLWGDLPKKAKVRREVEDHGASVPWLWTVCILLAKASGAQGRIEVEPGVPMRDDEIRADCPLPEAEFRRAMAVLFRWGKASESDGRPRWLRRDPDGCVVVANLEGRQETPKAAMMRRLRDSRRGNSTGNSSGNSYREAEADRDPVGSLAEAEEERPSPRGEGAGNPAAPVPAAAAGVKAPRRKPRSHGAEAHVTLDTTTWTLVGLTDDDRDRLRALFPLVDPDAAARDVAEYARVDPEYRKHTNWLRTLHNRCRRLQSFAEARHDRAAPLFGSGRTAPQSDRPSRPALPEPPPAPDPPLSPPSVDWPRVVDVLSARLAPEQVDRWIRPLRYVGDRGRDVCLEAPDAFAARWVCDNQRGAIEDALRDTTGLSLGMRVAVAAATGGAA